MKVYVGQTRARWLTAELASLGWGECCNRGELPPRRVPWFFDNGAFKDWKAEKEWDEVAYRADLALIRKHRIVRPDFVVAPDIVAGGMGSYERSRAWLDELSDIGPVYLAVQDGMPFDAGLLDGFSGVFVGGELDWKLATGHDWVRVAHRVGVPCHIGRVGSGKRVKWAREINADSIDSCLPLWSKENLRTFRRAIESTQLELVPLIPEDRLTNKEFVTMREQYDYHAKRAYALAMRLRREHDVVADTARRGA